VLLPHEIRRPEAHKPDDRFLCDILSLMTGEEDVFAALGTYSSATLKAMIGQCDLVVGSRFHSLVAALSQGVPSVALGWAHKYVELLGDFGQEDLVIDRGHLSEQEFVDMVTGAWERREESAATIRGHLPAVKKRVGEVFDQTAAIIRS
jgi:colanic acid/amylovoran biosynthesis protein